MNETCNEGTHGPSCYAGPAMQVFLPSRYRDEGDEGPGYQDLSCYIYILNFQVLLCRKEMKYTRDNLLSLSWYPGISGSCYAGPECNYIYRNVSYLG
jgi:hypothetical protein